MDAYTSTVQFHLEQALVTFRPARCQRSQLGLLLTNAIKVVDNYRYRRGDY